jgi:hypothetical protein
MTSHRLALWAAAVAVVVWALKAIAIAVAGGLGKSPFEDVLFFGGLLALVVAVVSVGVAAARGARLWVRVLAAVGACVASMIASLVANLAVAAVRGPEEGASWVWGELNLWALALLALVVAVTVHRARPARP